MNKNEKIVGQTQLTKEIAKIFKIFKGSNSEIRVIKNIEKYDIN